MYVYPPIDRCTTMKIQFKELTGKEYGPPPKEAKKKKDQAAAAPPQQQEVSEKNKEKKAKKAEEKRRREEEKAQKRAEREAREQAKRDRQAGIGQEEYFGDATMVQSQHVSNKKWMTIHELQPKLNGQQVLVRGFLQTTRGVGKGVCVVLRSTMYTVQGVCFQSTNISP